MSTNTIAAEPAAKTHKMYYGGEWHDAASGGDEVIGYTDNRASQAEYVLLEAANLTAKPAHVPSEVAGALFVSGVTGVATVRARSEALRGPT